MSEELLSEDEIRPPQEVEKENPPRKKKKYVKYSPLMLILLSVCAFVFSFSVFGFFEQSMLDLAGGAEIKTMFANVFGPVDWDGGISPDGTEISPSSSSRGNWQSISPESIDTGKLPFLQSLSFDGLKAQNPDTVAWMYWPTTVDVKGLPFNLPVVQSGDNDYYLERSFDRSYSLNGWIYADFRCDMSDLLSSRNTILYGHARSNLIFGGLRYLNTKTKWQQDAYNHFIYINTPEERTVWQIFAWYETTVHFNYIDTTFNSDGEYVQFLNSLQSNNTVSAFEKFNFTADDRILTLSTCKGTNSDVRIAIHAVLVKHEKNGVVTEPYRPPYVETPGGGGVSGTVTDGGSAPEGTDLPVTDVPVTDLPTDVPATDAPTDVPTDVPVTDGPTADVPTEGGPSTDLPATDVPTTDVSGTESPSDVPTTDVPVGSDPSAGGPEDSGTTTEPPSTDTQTPSDTESDGNSSDLPATQDPPVDSGSDSSVDSGSSAPDGGSESVPSTENPPTEDTGTPPDVPVS